MITQIENTIKEKKKYGAMRETKSEKNLINEKKNVCAEYNFYVQFALDGLKMMKEEKKSENYY